MREREKGEKEGQTVKENKGRGYFVTVRERERDDKLS